MWHKAEWMGHPTYTYISPAYDAKQHHVVRLLFCNSGKYEDAPSMTWLLGQLWAGCCTICYDPRLPYVEIWLLFIRLRLKTIFSEARRLEQIGQFSRLGKASFPFGVIIVTSWNNKPTASFL